MSGIRLQVPEACAGISMSYLGYRLPIQIDKDICMPWTPHASHLSQKKLARLRATLRIFSRFLPQVFDHSLRMDNIH